jgi:hypothetical protein
VGSVEIGEVEKLYRKELNNIMGDLNNKNFTDGNQQQAIAYCRSLELLSDLFDCCGVKGPAVK